MVMHWLLWIGTVWIGLNALVAYVMHRRGCARDAQVRR